MTGKGFMKWCLHLVVLGFAAVGFVSVTSPVLSDVYYGFVPSVQLGGVSAPKPAKDNDEQYESSEDADGTNSIAQNYLPRGKRCPQSLISTSNNEIKHGGTQGSWSDCLLGKLQADYFTKTKHRGVQISATMLRTTRPVVGHTERLHLFLRKLTAGKCVKVVIAGGSVTSGHNSGKAQASYVYHLFDWLNEQFPCRNETGARSNHTRVMLDVGGSNTAVLLDSFDEDFKEIHAFDLLLWEFNVNDIFIDNAPYIDRKAHLESQEQWIQWNNEIFIRKALLLRKPDPVAVVYFIADYHGRAWADKPWADPAAQLKSTSFGLVNTILYPLLMSYGVPTFSVVDGVFKHAYKLNRTGMFTNDLIFSTSRFHADACCHPFWTGHYLLAATLIYNLNEELGWAGVEVTQEEKDWTAMSPPRLPTPLRLTEQEDEVYVRQGVFMSLNFMHPSGRAYNSSRLKKHVNWEWVADNKENDKFGLQTSTLGAVVTFAVTTGKLGSIRLNTLLSYETFSDAVAFVTTIQEVPGKDLKSVCDGTDKDLPLLAKVVVRGTETYMKESVPRLTMLRNLFIKPEHSYFLHVCTTVSHANKNWVKFKILDVFTL